MQKNQTANLASVHSTISIQFCENFNVESSKRAEKNFFIINGSCLLKVYQILSENVLKEVFQEMFFAK